MRRIWKLGGVFLVALTLMGLSFAPAYADVGDTSSNDIVSVAGKPVVTIVSTCIEDDLWKGETWEDQVVISKDLPQGMEVQFQMSEDESDDSWGLCTMTLNNCTVNTNGKIPTGSDGSVPVGYIRCDDCDLNLVLHGSNVFKGATNENLSGIYMYGLFGDLLGRLDISGDGSLAIDLSDANYTFGIQGMCQVNIDGVRDLNIIGGNKASNSAFYGITMHPRMNYVEGHPDCHIRIKDSNVTISNTSKTASNFGIDSQDADLIIENSTIGITLTGGSSCGLAAGWYSGLDDKAYGGKLSIDSTSLVTAKLLGKVDPGKNGMPTLYYFTDNIKSPYIYTGDPGTEAKKTGKATFEKNIDRMECYNTFLEFAPSARSHDNPVIPGKKANPAIAKANPMTVKANAVTAKAKAKKTTVAAKKAFTVKNSKGTVTYKKMSGNAKITVAKTGKVTVKKGLKKGKTYTVKVKVSDSGNAQYKAGAKTVSLKVKIK